MRPDPALATYLTTITGSWSVWALPGAHGVCVEVMSLSERQVDGSCESLVAADSGEIVVRRVSPTGWVNLVGFVPDSNWYGIAIQSSRTQPIPVINNVWAITVPSGAYSVIVRDAAGRRHPFAVGSR